VTRPQSPIQITALGIIALLPSKERHARQHHEPARAPEKSIEPAHVPPFRPRSVQPSFCVGYAPQKLLFRLLAAKPVRKAPELAAVRWNQEMQAATVRELEWFRARLGVPHRCVTERHVGILTESSRRYQPIYQHFSRLTADERGRP
jgi:hypothetical protein